MIRFGTSSLNDIEQLSEWIKADPYHNNCLLPHWWLTGNGLLSFCILDDHGPVAFIRLDKELDKIRLHTQFGPRKQVNRKRLIDVILKSIPLITEFAKSNASGLVYRSTNVSLIRFMTKYFKFVSAQNDDYVLLFEELCADHRTNRN